MSDTSTTPTGSYSCEYCRQTSTITSDTTCPRCGAPINLTRRVSDAGWVALPPSRDLARIQFGHSTAQIAGKAVPVCDVNLAVDEQIVFFHSELLWSSGVKLSAVRSNAGMSSRLLGGVPRLMMAATGPGNVALSADWAGELVVVPLNIGQSIAAAEHHLMLATPGVHISVGDTGLFISEEENDSMGDVVSRYVNYYTPTHGPGLVVLHAPGNVVVRDLAPGEVMLVQPASVVYTDVSVSRQLTYEGNRPTFQGGLANFAGRTIYMTRLTGPGRIALASVYEHVPLVPGNTSLYGGFASSGGQGLGGIIGGAAGIGVDVLGGGSDIGGGIVGGIVGGTLDGGIVGGIVGGILGSFLD